MPDPTAPPVRRDSTPATPGAPALRILPESLDCPRAWPPAGPQPEPRFAFVNSVKSAGAWWTAITRVWPSGGAAKCRLCPASSCSVSQDVCQILVDRFVPLEEALSYSTVGFVRTRNRQDDQA